MISSPDAAAELLSDEDLKKAALDYLKSYETTQAHLRTILLRKVQRKIKGTDFEVSDIEDAITRTIRHCVEKNYVNDTRFAELFIDSARARGFSRRKIEGKLRLKGLNPDDFRDLLTDHSVSELDAAVTFSRKKKIGPFREHHQDQFRHKDLGKLARQGFSFDVCNQVLEGRFNDEN